MIPLEFAHLFPKHINDEEDDEGDSSDWPNDAVIEIRTDFGETECNASC